MIDLVCPACRNTFHVGVARLGARARCPVCHRLFVVGDPEQQPRPANTRRVATGLRKGAVVVALLLGLIALCTVVAASLTSH
jgi:hypothetical protein